MIAEPDRRAGLDATSFRDSMLRDYFSSNAIDFALTRHRAKVLAR